MEMKREADSNDKIGSSHDDKPSVGMFVFSSLLSVHCLHFSLLRHYVCVSKMNDPIC